MLMRLDFISKIILAAGLFFGLPFLSIGLYEIFQNMEMFRGFIETRGVVVANSYATTYIDGSEGGVYYPVVEFTDLNNKKVRFTEGIGSLPADFEIGEEVEVLYDPHEPKEVRIKTWKRLWLAPTIFSAVGLLPIIICLIVVGKIESAFRTAY